jgi:hypothetical protein
MEIRLWSRYGQNDRQLIEIGGHDLIPAPCHGPSGEHSLARQDFCDATTSVFQLLDLHSITYGDASGVSLLDASS